MATVLDSSALKCDTSNKNHGSFVQLTGLVFVFSMSVSLLAVVMPGQTSGFKEILGVFVLYSFFLAAKGWLSQRTPKRKTFEESVALTCLTNDDDKIEKPSSLSYVDCRQISTTSWFADSEVAEKHLPATPRSDKHGFIDTCDFVNAAPFPDDVIETPVDMPCFMRATVLAISRLGDPVCVESFFKHMSVDGLEPSPIMQQTLMSICMRKPNAYEAEAFLARLLKTSAGAEIDAFSSFVDTCVCANDLGLSVDVDAAYSSLVHACLLLEM